MTTDILSLIATWLTCLWFGEPEEDEPDDDVDEDFGDLLRAWADRRGLEAWAIEDLGHWHAIVYDESHANEAGRMAGTMITAMAFESEGEATVRIQ